MATLARAQRELERRVEARAATAEIGRVEMGEATAATDAVTAEWVGMGEATAERAELGRLVTGPLVTGMAALGMAERAPKPPRASPSKEKRRPLFQV